MTEQKMMYQLALRMGRNHPELYAKFINMSQPEVAEFISTTYNVTLVKGTSWNDMPAILDRMDEAFYARCYTDHLGAKLDVQS